MTIRDIDYDLRKLNSIILRIILIAILINIYAFNANIFSKWVYFISICSYIILLFFNLFYVKEKYKGKIRLLLDLIIICIFLYYKNLNHIINFMPFFLLLYNVQSHSNKNDSFFLFLFSIHFSILLIDNFSVILTHHLIPIIFYLFIFIISIRKAFSSINEEIIILVGDLFIENVNENNSHRILRNVISKINISKVKVINQVNEIFLFVSYNEKLVLIKGSKFVINNEIISELDVKQIISKNVKNKRILKDIVIVDDVKYDNCYWINHKVQDKDYFFLVSLNKESIFNDSLILNLRPIFEYIARVYFMSNSLIEINTSNLKIIKQKIAYVFDAQNALHFVKNKLSPITSTIDLMDRYFKDKGLTKEKKDYIEKRLLKNTNNAEIKSIIKKAEVLIKGVDNIINEKDDLISLKILIDNLRKNWLFHFNNIDEVLLRIDDLNNIKIEINQMMFDFVFTDIIENINKYGIEENKKVELFIDNGYIIILFSNEIKDLEKNKQELDEIVMLYNLKDNDEIYSRKTHGLSFIRRLLRKKNIQNNIFINNSNKTFNNEIKIKIYQNEHISL